MVPYLTVPTQSVLWIPNPDPQHFPITCRNDQVRTVLFLLHVLLHHSDPGAGGLADGMTPLTYLRIKNTVSNSTEK